MPTAQLPATGEMAHPQTRSSASVVTFGIVTVSA